MPLASGIEARLIEAEQYPGLFGRLVLNRHRRVAANADTGYLMLTTDSLMTRLSLMNSPIWEFGIRNEP